MLWVYKHYKHFYSFSVGIDFSNQNIDVYRRQIITFEVDPHAVRLKVCILLTRNVL